MKRHGFLSELCRAVALCALLVGIAWGCANPGTPTGGPKDRTPPVVVSSNPENGATDFTGKIITITFDENIQLTDADSKFVMSPPTAKKPKVSSHAKTVTVTFEDDLLPATTYTLDFADCLSDLNESNVYQNLTLSFSTGESTDSMMISGNVYDAETLSPIEGIYVLLQNNLTDTAFHTVVPVRIAKTDANGRFAVKNVPAETHYNIFALDDQNRNFLFDQPGEKIAWLGHTVTPSWEIRQIADSVRTDSTYLDGDTVRFVYDHIMRDTLTYTPDSLILWAYNEENYDQYIKTDSRPARNKISVTLNKPMDRRPRISFVDQGPTESIATIQYSLTNDTVNIWMTDTTIWKKDSVVIAVNYLVLDSLGQMIEKTDTLKEWHVERAAAKKPDNNKRRKKEKEDKAEAVTLKVEVPGSVAPHGEFAFKTNTPIGKWDWDGIKLFHKVDTIYEQIKYTAIDDTINLCHRALKIKWTPGETYRLTIDSASIADIYGLACDAHAKNFDVTKLERYGTMYIDVDSVPDNALLQLTDTKGTVVRQNYLKANGKAGFRYLKPTDYMVRILVDSNRNGKWDPGSYEEQREPEQYIYYMEKVTVRANWDIHIDFNTHLFTPDKYAKKFGQSGKKKKKR